MMIENLNLENYDWYKSESFGGMDIMVWLTEENEYQVKIVNQESDRNQFHVAAYKEDRELDSAYVDERKEAHIKAGEFIKKIDSGDIDD